MVGRFWVSMLALTSWLPVAGALAVLEGCSHGAEIGRKEAVEQRTGDRDERRRERRDPRLERKEYDG